MYERDGGPDLRARNYRRGAIMGLAMAEVFLLLTFILLLLLVWWHRSTVEKYDDQLKTLADMTPAQREATVAIAKANLSPEDLARLQHSADAPDILRFIPERPIRDVTDAMTGWTEPQQLAFGDLVGKLPPDEVIRLARIISEKGLPEDILARIEAASTAEAGIAAALQARLGDLVKGMGGTIDSSGAITLPEQAMFARGSAEVSPQLRAFLAQFCVPWLTELERSGVPISDVRIEGHASSEWADADEEQAYLHNLGLSQSRSEAVLRECLMQTQSDALRKWARVRLEAIGFSSARPVTDGAGGEDQSRSRRVVFTALPDRAQLLRDIERSARAATANAGYARTEFMEGEIGGCPDFRTAAMRDLSETPVVMSADGCKLVSGTWTDAYTGISHTIPADLQVDHIVPLAWAWDHGAQNWTRAERVVFGKDPQNLVAVASEVNRAKGSAAPDGWLPLKAQQCRYIARFREIAGTYDLVPSAEALKAWDAAAATCGE